ncbi:MAG TPA: hypothetical protein VMI12_13730 [Puia sp.]|nr:hypothetical protein [Puia sp.]
MQILKQIEYKKIKEIEGKKIDLLINDIIYKKKWEEKKNKATQKDDFKNWIMPEEPKGYIRAKKHDPL